MTQALMELTPRLDLKPAGGPGESRGSADSGAAFADAVDQAVTEFQGRSDAPGRNESDRDHDRRTADAPGRRDGDDRGDLAPADDAATAPLWTPIPQDLHAARAAKGDRPDGRLDVADATARPTRRTDIDTARDAGHDADAGAANRGAAATMHATPAVAADPHTAAAAQHAAVATATVAPDGYTVPAKADARTIGKAADGMSTAGSPTAGTTVGSTTATAHTTPATTSTATGAGTTETQGAAPVADRARVTANGDAHRDARAATAAKDPASTALTQAPAATGRPPERLAADNGTNAAETGDESRPGPSEIALSKRVKAHAAANASANAIAHAAENSAVKSAANSVANSTTGTAIDAAASQVSPIVGHVPTAVAATVNSTPVAVTTPMPTPFTQAQPDVANILAQLRGRSDGAYQLRAQVHPAELGAVSITATVHHGALTLTLTPDQSAQQAISQSLPQLRQHLADQGFTGVNVGLGSPDQSGQHGRSGDRESRAQGSDHSSLHGPDVAIGAVDHGSARRAAGTQSALDLML